MAIGTFMVEAPQPIKFEGVAVKIVSLRYLEKAKRNSDRARDLADVDELLKIIGEP